MFRLRNYMKLINTFSIYCAFLCLGLLLSIVGPSILDLQHLIRTDRHHISHVYTARSMGHVLGAILSGVVLDMVHFRQGVLSACCFAVGGTMIGVPWCRSFASLAGLMMVNGLFLGALETGGNICVLGLWGKESGPVFQGLHFTLGLGGFVAPLIAAPFLEYRLENAVTGDSSPMISEDSSTNYPNMTSHRPLTINSTDVFTEDSSLNPLAVNGDLASPQRVPGIVYPFSIVGSIACLAAVLLLVTGVASKSDREQDGKDEPERDSGRSRGFVVAVILLTFLLIFVSCAMEIGFAQMLTSYAVKGSLHLTVTQGSYLTSAFWATFTMSRLASAFLALRVRNLVLIVGDLLLVSVASLLLLLLTPGEAVLWVATVAFGTGIGSLYASIVGWVNGRVAVTSQIAAIITVGAAGGEMAGPVTISYFMDTMPDMFAYFVAAACLLTWIVLLGIYAFLRKYDRTVHPKCLELYTVRTWSINS